MADYYPGGMMMPGRKYSVGNEYRYGFNGQENSYEIAAGLTTAMYWEYDSRIGRRWNRDPILSVWESPYATFHNNPIFFSDRNGDTPGPGDRAKKYAEKNKLENYKISPMKSGAGSYLSWVDNEGTAHSIRFRTKRSDISENSSGINGSQFQAMAAVEGIQKGSSVQNWVSSNIFSPTSDGLKGTYICSPYGGYLTDTKEEGADRFNMYVNDGTTLNVDESQAYEFADYEKYVVSQLMTNFVKGTGAENYVFPTNGIISSKFLNSDVLNEAIKRFNNGETIDHTQISFGLKELAKDYRRNGTFYSITGFVGSASITMKQTDKGIMVQIFNITSITSGDLFKNPSNDKKWPKSFIRDWQTKTPYGNIGQTFNLLLPNR